MSKKAIYVWGHHSVRHLLEHNPHGVLELWIRDGADSEVLADIAERCRAHGIAVQPAGKQALDRLADGALHQGVVAKRLPPPTRSLDSLLEALSDRQTPALLLALDRVQDPQNFGACLRVAEAAGVDAVLTAKDGSAPLSGTVFKAASGAMDTMTLVSCSNLARGLRSLQDAGIWITGAAGAAATPYFEADFKVPSCVVVGAEGRGLRRLTAEHCDTMVGIPMRGEVASLNVATATAVCLFEAVRQRYGSG